MSRRPPVGGVGQELDRMAPGGALWSESPVRRPSRKVRRAGVPAVVEPPVDPWVGVGHLEFSGLWRVGGQLYCDTITDWGTTLTHPATATYVEVITYEGYAVRWYADAPPVNRWLIKIHSANNWYLWNFNVPQLYNGQTGTPLPTSTDKAVPSGSGSTIFDCITMEGGGAGSASVAGSIRLRKTSVP